MYASLNATALQDLHRKQRLGAWVAARPLITRIAPSPTGHLHMGTIRVALHNWLAARASGGTFGLRIDDTDAQRNQAAAVDLIHTSLDRLGLHPDGCFHQSARRAAHQTAPHARDLAPATFFDAVVGTCPISDTWLNHADGLVLLRQDGSPTYHLASVVDDMDAGVNGILRGMDHLANTPKQLIVARALAQAGHPTAATFCQQALFGHCGLLMVDGHKMSKRDPSSNGSQWLDTVGPQALLQGALTLGWGHPNPQFGRTYPTLSLDAMVPVFAQGSLRAANSQFDGTKLHALARKWANRMALTP